MDAVARAGNVVLVELLTGKCSITDQTGRHVGMLWEEETLPPFPALAVAASGLALWRPKEGAAVSQFWGFRRASTRPRPCRRSPCSFTPAATSRA